MNKKSREQRLAASQLLEVAGPPLRHPCSPEHPLRALPVSRPAGATTVV
jgi:hypothetical protein